MIAEIASDWEEVPVFEPEAPNYEEASLLADTEMVALNEKEEEEERLLHRHPARSFSRPPAGRFSERQGIWSPLKG